MQFVWRAFNFMPPNTRSDCKGWLCGEANYACGVRVSVCGHVRAWNACSAWMATKLLINLNDHENDWLVDDEFSDLGLTVSVNEFRIDWNWWTPGSCECCRKSDETLIYGVRVCDELLIWYKCVFSNLTDNVLAVFSVSFQFNGWPRGLQIVLVCLWLFCADTCAREICVLFERWRNCWLIWMIMKMSDWWMTNLVFWGRLQVGTNFEWR